VADEFKKKYYDVLSNNPRLFARFFKEDSALTVAMPDAQPQSGSGPAGIQQLMERTVPGAKVTVQALQVRVRGRCSGQGPGLRGCVCS